MCENCGLEYEAGVEEGRRQAFEDVNKMVACDFCGVSDVPLVAGPGRTGNMVYICFDCAQTSLEILAPDPD